MTNKYPIYFSNSRAGTHVYVDIGIEEVVIREVRNHFMFPGTPTELRDFILKHTSVLWVDRETGATSGKTEPLQIT